MSDATDTTKTFEVDASEDNPHPARTWARSIPAMQSPLGGVQPHILDEIRRYDSRVRVRFDPKHQCMVLFQSGADADSPQTFAAVDEDGQTKVFGLIGHHEPGEGKVDERLLQAVQDWDMRRWGMSMTGLLSAMREANKQRDKAARDEIWNGIDHHEGYHAFQRYLTSVDGNQRNLRSAVPDQLVNGLKAELSRRDTMPAMSPGGIILP
jgi:hypothetical protein